MERSLVALAGIAFSDSHGGSSVHKSRALPPSSGSGAGRSRAINWVACVVLGPGWWWEATLGSPMTSYYEVFEVHQAAEQESNQEVESLGYPQGSGREEWDDWAHHPGGVGQWSGQSYQESPSHTRSGWHAGRSWSVRWSGWGQRHYDNWSWDGQQSESGSVGSRASYANHPVPTTSFC